MKVEWDAASLPAMISMLEDEIPLEFRRVRVEMINVHAQPCVDIRLHSVAVKISFSTTLGVSTLLGLYAYTLAIALDHELGMPTNRCPDEERVREAAEEVHELVSEVSEALAADFLNGMENMLTKQLRPPTGVPPEVAHGFASIFRGGVVGKA
jgi:hypothetical protein